MAYMNTNDNLFSKKIKNSVTLWDTPDSVVAYRSYPAADHTNIYLACATQLQGSVGRVHGDNQSHGKSAVCLSVPIRQHRLSAQAHHPSVRNRIHQRFQGFRRISCTLRRARSRDPRFRNCSRLSTVSRNTRAERIPETYNGTCYR